MRRALLPILAVVATVRANVTPDAPAIRTAESAEAVAAAPLLVVLHGNNETGELRGSKWREALARRGGRLLALDCPGGLGCNEQGQWYMWNGSARWVMDRVEELAAREHIDMSRVYLAGWSGGATYIGKHVHEWSRMFAAVVIHGGGVEPRTTACPERPLPAYFLVGDRNPAHGGARRLRSYLESCRQDVKWDLLPGANHPKEDAALTFTKADEILKWLDSQRNSRARWHGV